MSKHEQIKAKILKTTIEYDQIKTKWNEFISNVKKVCEDLNSTEKGLKAFSFDAEKNYKFVINYFDISFAIKLSLAEKRETCGKVTFGNMEDGDREEKFNELEKFFIDVNGNMLKEKDMYHDSLGHVSELGDVRYNFLGWIISYIEGY